MKRANLRRKHFEIHCSRGTLLPRLLCTVLLAAGGCATHQMSLPEVMSLPKYPIESYVQENAARPTPRELDVQAAIDLALKNNAQIVYLREAAEVARAQAGAALEFRDPELIFAYGEGERKADRSWLVPRSELAPLYSYPSKGYLISEDPNQLAKETDPMVQRALIPPGGQYNYLTMSSNTFSGTTMDSDAYKIGVRFFPPNPWTARARLATYRAEYAAALADAYVMEWEVASRVRELYAWIAYLRQDLALAREQAEVRQNAATSAATLVDNGQIPTVEALAAAQRHLQAQADCDKQEHEIRLAVTELGTLIGRSVPEEAIRTQSNSTTTLDEKTLDALELQRKALRNRREIAAAYWRSQQAEAALREARSTRIPWLTGVEGTYSESNRREDPDAAWGLEGRTAELDPFYSIPIDNEEDTEWRVEAVVSIPLFSLGPQVTRVQRAQYRQAMETLGALTRQTLSEVTDALASLRRIETRSTAFQADCAARLAHAQDALNEMQKNPGFAPDDAIRLREIAIDLQRMRARLEYDRQMAILQLGKSVGVDFEE
jgi:outer membrane protein TolC